MEMVIVGKTAKLCKLTFCAYNKKIVFLILNFKYLNFNKEKYQIVVTIISLQKEGVMI
jgi:hypothetical protein